MLGDLATTTKADRILRASRQAGDAPVMYQGAHRGDEGILGSWRLRSEAAQGVQSDVCRVRETVDDLCVTPARLLGGMGAPDASHLHRGERLWCWPEME